MACDIAIHGSVVLVVWGTPELADLHRVEAAVSAVYEERGPVVFIGRVPPHAAAPSESVRDELSAMMTRFMRKLASYHAVIEGRGFFAATKRTVLATVFLVAGRRYHYHVHATIDEVPLAVLPSYQGAVQNALSRFRGRGHLPQSVRPSAVDLQVS